MPSPSLLNLVRVASTRTNCKSLLALHGRQQFSTSSRQGDGAALTSDFGKQHVARGVNRLTDAVIKSGNGSYLEMEDGRQMLDFTCGIAVTNLGHCHPKVSEAAAKQCLSLVHGQCSVAFHNPYLKLIQRLVPLMPHPSLDTFFFWNSGAEAVEASIKLARSSTGRQNIIVMQGGYHGRTFGTMSLTRSKTIYSDGFSPLMPGVYVTPFPYWHQMGLPQTTSEDELVRICLMQLKLLLSQQTSPSDTAAILVEPVIGEGGYSPSPPAFLHGLREICDQHGILLICDEVQSGFGRTGKMFFSEYSGVRPDIMVMAKGLANGFPLSAIVSRKGLMDKQKPGSMGGTYAGNAVSCAAAVAVTEVFAEEKILENVQARSKQLFAGLQELRDEVGEYILEVRGSGLMVGLEFASPAMASFDPVANAAAPAKMASRVSAKCMEHEMLLLTTSVFEVVRFMPPLNISEEDMSKGLEIFKQATTVLMVAPSLFLPSPVSPATLMTPITRLGFVLALFLSVSKAYIPATPSNDTSTIPTPDNADSTVVVRWTNQGYYREGISRQLQVEGGSTGIEKGALVHFSENATIPAWMEYTTTPWIALVPIAADVVFELLIVVWFLDATPSDMDIFTLARDRGAVASLLYSTWSQTCLLNPDYADPALFDQVLDIYTTIRRSSARLIESQFQNVNRTEFFWFNATRLNSSANSVNNAILGNGVQPGYLIATVKLQNVTDPSDGLTNTNTTNGAHPAGSDKDKGPNTGLAMIILYTITGCVSALFCIVVVSGTIRAIRNPERYGPRRGDPTIDGFEGESQTRAAGLTRAILDTFPVIKFGRANNANPNTSQVTSHGPSAPVSYGYKAPSVMMDSDLETAADHAGRGQAFELTDAAHAKPSEAVGSSSTMLPEPSYTPDTLTRRASSSQGHGEGGQLIAPSGLSPPTKEMIGIEICPICLTEFEEGDDLRVLPCEGQHKFHPDCIDPWLLQVSGLCPLCREDFTALENMANGVAPEATQNMQQPQAHGVSRFSRYLSNAQRRLQDRSSERQRSNVTLHDPPV
ncbi:hypothetical protein FRB99_005467 [Tulasnella sp. 403]|nr:hypothetical protein FRB99_005467 [Tulasnella sp. 403]